MVKVVVVLRRVAEKVCVEMVMLLRDPLLTHGQLLPTGGVWMDRSVCRVECGSWSWHSFLALLSSYIVSRSGVKVDQLVPGIRRRK